MPEQKVQERNHQRNDHSRQHHREPHREPQQERRTDIPRAHYPTPPQIRYPQNMNPHFLQPQFSHPHVHHHGRPQINQFNNFDYRNNADLRRYQHPHFSNPYDGMNNFWNDRHENNYYYDGPRHHHHHHHRHKDDFFPRLLEGIVGGILSGTIVRELEKIEDLSDKPDNDRTKRNNEFEEIDDNDVESRGATREDFTPDRQILLNLDLQARTPADDVNSRFERTG
ncbi:MAG TPA: hypothetical protein PKZ32_21270 [Candidatus Melainabacteria bacterium]|nr:hypothetical protein [Candidatus Melainabacteria bacterium]